MSGGSLYAQNVTAVGWVGNTVPSDLPGNKGIVELPTSDCSNPGIVVGAALAGQRPIYIIRYQGFLWYNLATLVNYAAKSKEMWKTPCPIFIRALAMEGGMGPVAGNLHHSMAMRMPGIKVAAPMTPGEWKQVWDEFMVGDDPVLCSESRLSFGIDYEMGGEYVPGAKVTIFAIGTARLSTERNCHLDVPCNLFEVVWLKPSRFPDGAIRSLKGSEFGVVVDGDYETCGAS
jgi:pyruvate/2-oxoglutarate/acetoin dehydrogenase E1 component